MRRYRGQEPGIPVTAIIPISIFQKIEEEREQTGETRSALLASLIVMCFEEDVEQKAENI